MTKKNKEIGSTFEVKNLQVGDGARVAAGQQITWTEGSPRDSSAADLERQFTNLLEQIEEAEDLDEDQRLLAKEKASAVATGLAKANEEPGLLRRALLDMKNFVATTAGWIGHSVGNILRSEAAQKTISSITEAGTQAAIKAFQGM
jgi:hypothetical protein